MSTEVVERSEDLGLVPAPRRQGDALVRPVAIATDVVAAFQEYKRMSEAILEDSDRIEMGKRSFTKRSGWRKLATAYGVDLEVLPRNIHVDRDEAGRILRATVFARAIAPNGRYADGVGVCDRYERCCPALPPDCNVRHREGPHCRSVEKPTCTKAHFSNYEHDLVATASTRAMNRAAADLFGLGEVSAEEITNRGPELELATEAQIEEIILLAGRSGSSVEMICKSWGVGSLQELTAARATGTIARLNELLKPGEDTPSEADPATPPGPSPDTSEVSAEDETQEAPADDWAAMISDTELATLLALAGEANVAIEQIERVAHVDDLAKLTSESARRQIGTLQKVIADAKAKTETEQGAFPYEKPVTAADFEDPLS